MAKKAGSKLWDDVPDADNAFENEAGIVDVEVSEYLPQIMTMFSANLSYARQLPKVSDGLKPVARRILNTMYKQSLRPDRKAAKSANVVGTAMTWHPHADGSIYNTLINMSQVWTKNLAPVEIIGGKGTISKPDSYSHMRYTEARLSKYGWDCFFSDLDETCVEMIKNYTKDELEAVVLPAKYPDILLNGGTGIAVGNSYGIPPYRPEDVVGLIKKLIKNPHARDCVLIPDIPSGCELIDDGNFVKIAETGKGVLTMRAIIDISEGKWAPGGGKHTRPVWILTVKSIPWMTDMEKVIDKINEMARNKELPILDIKDETQGYYVTDEIIEEQICVEIIIDRNLDPYQIKSQLYAKTDLQKSQSIQFNAVTDDLKVEEMNLRSIALAWIDSRREYKRRFFNRKLRTTMTNISFLEIMIDITSGNKLEKTVKILKNSSGEEQLQQLMKHGNMNSFQAAKVLEMKMGVISKNANAKFKADLEEAEKTLEEVKDILRSEKKIDNIIIEELEGLKKYYRPRVSPVVTLDNEKVVSNEKVILVVTKKGKVKKLPEVKQAQDPREIFNGNKNRLGAFDQYDYPTHAISVYNYDAVTFIDSLGRFSTIPVNLIPNTESSNTGYKLYDFTRLDGEILTVFECSTPEEDAKKIKAMTGEEVHQVFLTAQGMIKQIPLSDFMITGNNKKIKNARCMKLKDDDTLVWTGAMLEGTNLAIFTRKGEYAYVNAGNIPLSNKDTMGNIGVKCKDGDSCVGCCVIGDNPYMLVVTSRGCVKRVEIDFMGAPGKRMRSSYLATVEDNDDIIFCLACNGDEELVVVCKSGIKTLNVEDIPVMGRKGKPKKMIPVALGDAIALVYTRKIED